MTRPSKLLFSALSLAALAQPALAQDGTEGTEAGAPAEGEAPMPPPEEETTAPAEPTGVFFTKLTWPEDFNARPLTLAKGMIEIRGDVFINLSKDAAGEPISIAPDVYYGVSDQLSVGLTHNLGICVTGEEGGCAKVYNDFGLDALYSFKRDAAMELAAHVGLRANTIDPFALALRAGVSVKYVTGKIGIYADPFLQFGITEREPEAADPGTIVFANKEAIAIPVTVSYQATPKLNAFLRTGLSGFNVGTGFGVAPFEDLGDLYAIPLGVGALFAVSNKLDVGAMFNLPLLAGGTAWEDITGADARTLDILVNYRL